MESGVQQFYDQIISPLVKYAALALAGVVGFLLRFLFMRTMQRIDRVEADMENKASVEDVQRLAKSIDQSMDRMVELEKDLVRRIDDVYRLLVEISHRNGISSRPNNGDRR